MLLDTRYIHKIRSGMKDCVSIFVYFAHGNYVCVQCTRFPPGLFSKESDYFLIYISYEILIKILSTENINAVTFHLIYSDERKKNSFLILINISID